MALLILTSSVLTLTSDVLASGVTYGKRANWATNSPMNRSTPVVSYSSSDAMTFEFGVELYATDQQGPAAIAEAVRSLNALVYPIEPGVTPPPVCYLTYPAGGFDNWMCVCVSVSASNPSNVWEKETGFAFHATATISLMELDFDGKSADEFAGRISNLTSRYR